MTRVQQQLSMLAGLLIVMVLVYGPRLRVGSSAERPTETNAPVSHEEPSVTASPDVSTQLAAPWQSPSRAQQHRRADTLAWGRDPFHPAGSSSTVGGLPLSGILWDATTPMAIINGQMMQIGETIDEFRVMEILPDHVSVTDGAQTYQLLIAP